MAAAVLAQWTPSASAQTMEVVTRPIPQAYSDTCQSYALAFALARAGAPGFPLATVADVRRAETTVRAAITSATLPGHGPYEHQVWAGAVSALTSGRFALRRKEYATAEQLYDDVAARTGISAAATIGPSLSVSLSRVPVLTSFSRIGRSGYSTGHIVTIFGVDRPRGPSSSPAGLLLLNSAVKRPPGASPPFAPVCGPATTPGDAKYTGALALERDYALRTYGGRFVALWIEPA